MFNKTVCAGPDGTSGDSEHLEAEEPYHDVVQRHLESKAG